MHHALTVQEIVVDIFRYCCPPDLGAANPDLAALARTCHTFKEPALDILWEVLFDLTPLARCIPGASHQLYGNKYSLSKKNLRRADVDTLQYYTRRIRVIKCYEIGLNKKAVKRLLTALIDAPLFPNLRVLHCEYNKSSIPLLHGRLPSLVSLRLMFNTRRWFTKFLESFHPPFMGLGELFLSVDFPSSQIYELDVDHICRWKNLRSLLCSGIILDMDALIYLSGTLVSKLGFSLPSETLLFHRSHNPPLSFSNLCSLTLESRSLGSVSHLLCLLQLPIVTDVTTHTETLHSAQDLSLFFSAFQTSIAGATILQFELKQLFDDLPPATVLGLESLRPLTCMEFNNLRCLVLDVECEIYLTDGDMEMLTPSWPQLECLIINEHWGWRSQGGITPNGLIRLLCACPLLNHISVALDTRGFTGLRTDQSLESLGLVLHRSLSINVLDSAIQPECVPVVSKFFFSIATCLSLRLDFTDYSAEWEEVRGRVNRITVLHSMET